MASEATAALRSLQDAAAACKPINEIAFAIRFFQDEADPNPELAHAYHYLPYVLMDETLFRSYACTIFTSELTRTGKQRQSVGGDAITNIVSRMKNHDTFQTDSVVDEMVSCIISNLQNVDFQTFVAAIRLPICSYQILQWTLRTLEDCQNRANSVPTSKVDATVFENYLKRRPNYTRGRSPSDRDGQLYRWTQEDDSKWENMLKQVVSSMIKNGQLRDHMIENLHLARTMVNEYVNSCYPKS